MGVGMKRWTLGRDRWRFNAMEGEGQRKEEVKVKEDMRGIEKKR